MIGKLSTAKFLAFYKGNFTQLIDEKTYTLSVD